MPSTVKSGTDVYPGDLVFGRHEAGVLRVAETGDDMPYFFGYDKRWLRLEGDDPLVFRPMRNYKAIPERLRAVYEAAGEISRSGHTDELLADFIQAMCDWAIEVEQTVKELQWKS